MPDLASTDTNEAVVFDICPDFSGGQASAPRANLLNQNQASVLSNMDFDTQGLAKTRRGLRLLEDYSLISSGKVIRGGITLNIPDAKIITAVFNGSLYGKPVHAGDATAIVSGGTSVFSTGSYVATAHGALGAYYADGINYLGFFDGSTYVQRTNAPIGSLLCWHTNRLFVSGILGKPSTIRASGILDDRLWDNSFFSFDVGTNDGDKIVAIQPWQDRFLVVFKTNSVWMVDCNPSAVDSGGRLSASAWTVKCLSYKIGCIAPRSIAVLGPDIWFLAQDGCRTVTRLQATESQAGVQDVASAPIRDILGRFNRDAPAEAVGFSFDGCYFLSLPLDGSQLNTTTVVWRDNVQAWLGQWTWSATAFILDSSASPQRLLVSTTTGKLFEWLQYVPAFAADPQVFQDDGVGVASSVTTRAMICGEIMAPKIGSHWEIEYYLSRGATCTASFIKDSVPVATNAFTMDSRANVLLQLPFTSLPVSLPAQGVARLRSSLIHLEEWRELQVKLDNTDLLPMSLRYIGIAANIQPVHPET